VKAGSLVRIGLAASLGRRARLPDMPAAPALAVSSGWVRQPALFMRAGDGRVTRLAEDAPRSKPDRRQTTRRPEGAEVRVG